MHIDWVKGYSGKDKEKREKEIKSFNRAFDELSNLLKEETYTPDYDCPSWAHKQADQNGYNRAIRKVLTLINVKD